VQEDVAAIGRLMDAVAHGVTVSDR